MTAFAGDRHSTKRLRLFQNCIHTDDLKAEVLEAAILLTWVGHLAEVDNLFAKMYEDWSVGRITEYNFNMLSEKYQAEQRELDADPESDAE